LNSEHCEGVMAEQIRTYFAEGLGAFLQYLPNLVAGLVILVLGYLIARLLGAVTKKLLARAGFDGFMARRLHPKASEPSRPASRTAGSAVFWLVLLLTIALAAEALLIPALAAGIYGILAYVPNLIVAAIIVGVAIAIGNVMADFVKTTWLARGLRFAIIALAVFMALNQLGIATEIVTAAFIALVGAVAVAVAIAFGVGNIELAREYTRRFERRGKEELQEARREEAAREEPGRPTTPAGGPNGGPGVRPTRP
jgi:hypothetical protein